MSKEFPYEVVREKAWIIVAVRRGDAPSLYMRFYDALDEIGDKKRMTALLDAVAEHGPLVQREKSKHLRDGIFEFRPTSQVRIMWFYGAARTVVLTHAFRKKRSRVDPVELDRAQQLRLEFEAWSKRQ